MPLLRNWCLLSRRIRSLSSAKKWQSLEPWIDHASIHAASSKKKLNPSHSQTLAEPFSPSLSHTENCIDSLEWNGCFYMSHLWKHFPPHVLEAAGRTRPHPAHLCIREWLQCEWLAGHPGVKKWFLRPGRNATFSLSPSSLPQHVPVPEASEAQHSVSPANVINQSLVITVTVNRNEFLNDI
jgi:hypothetical protein